MSKALKHRITKELHHELSDREGFIMIGFRGMNSEQTHLFRKTLREKHMRVRVVKNRLALKAFEALQIRNAGSHLTDQSALVYGDSLLEVAKELAALKKSTKEMFKIHGAVLEGRAYDEQGAVALSKIPDRATLLAMLLGVMQAPVRGFAVSLKQIVNKLVYALEDLRKQREGA